VSGSRAEFAGVDDLYLPIAAGVFALVLVAVAITLVRYRARPGHAARPTRDHYALDVGLALVIGAVVAVLLAHTLPANSRETAVAARPAFRVDVVAFKWGWRFSYPSVPGVVDQSTQGRPAVLHVPAGRDVAFALRTHDVVHSFWIPDLRFKRDAWPRTVQRFDLRFDPGAADGVGHCAQFCGLGHAGMVFTIQGLTGAQFSAWAAGARG
jgi:cytochrome c oxidase subunit 2